MTKQKTLLVGVSMLATTVSSSLFAADTFLGYVVAVRRVFTVEFEACEGAFAFAAGDRTRGACDVVVDERAENDTLVSGTSFPLSLVDPRDQRPVETMIEATKSGYRVSVIKRGGGQGFSSRRDVREFLRRAIAKSPSVTAVVHAVGR